MGKIKLVILRGLPGSGKSFEATRMIKEGEVIRHYEADMFFVDEDGEYMFDPAQIKDAHAWCQRSVEQALLAGESVVVSNTFVRRWEMEFYLQLTSRLNVECVIRTCTGDWGNVHGVPESVVDRMRENWEHCI